MHRPQERCGRRDTRVKVGKFQTETLPELRCGQALPLGAPAQALPLHPVPARPDGSSVPSAGILGPIPSRTCNPPDDAGNPPIRRLGRAPPRGSATTRRTIDAPPNSAAMIVASSARSISSRSSLSSASRARFWSGESACLSSAWRFAHALRSAPLAERRHHRLADRRAHGRPGRRPAGCWRTLCQLPPSRSVNCFTDGDT